MLEVVPARSPASCGAGRPRLGPDDLVVISGGARGITAEVAVALARDVPAPPAGARPQPIARGRGRRRGSPPAATRPRSKRYLLSGPDRGRSPQAIGERVRRILANREIRDNLDRIAAAGSRVVYRSVDVRDRTAVRDVIARARDELGPIRGLIHGAGVLADRRIVDQTDAQFALVYDTKVAGLLNLFDAVDPEALEFLVLFSSSTARFGRIGQVAYAAANEYLNKWAQQAAIRLPDCRVVSFNWGPWAGGMVGDALRRVFEKEGLHLIPPEAGARLVIDEIRDGDAGPGPVEIVVLADRPAAAAPGPRRGGHGGRGPRPTGSSRRSSGVGSTSRRCRSWPTTSSTATPSCRWRSILEWAAEGAVHRNPGLVVRGVDDLRLFKGLILSGREPCTMEIAAGKAVREGDEFRVPVELRGALANGREVIHARAEVVLAARHATGARRLDDPALPRPVAAARRGLWPRAVPRPGDAGDRAGRGVRRARDRGAGRHVAVAVGVAGAAVALAMADRPPGHRLCLPARRALDPGPARGQLAADGRGPLPAIPPRIRRGPACGSWSRSARRPSPAPSPTSSSSTTAASSIARLESYECVVDASLSQAFRRNQLIAPTPVTAS